MVTTLCGVRQLLHCSGFRQFFRAETLDKFDLKLRSSSWSWWGSDYRTTRAYLPSDFSTTGVSPVALLPNLPLVDTLNLPLNADEVLFQFV